MFFVCLEHDVTHSHTRCCHRLTQTNRQSDRQIHWQGLQSFPG